MYSNNTNLLPLSRLESLCGRADTLCSTLGMECEEMGKRDTQRVSALQALEKDSVTLRSEIATLLSQYKVTPSFTGVSVYTHMLHCDCFITRVV